MNYEIIGKAAAASFNLRPEEISKDLNLLIAETLEANAAAMEIHSEPLHLIIQRMDEFILQVMKSRGDEIG